MGYIKILDTGYIRPTNSGTQYIDSERARSGSIITLKATEFVPNLSRNLSYSPTINNNSSSPVQLGSMGNMQFTLKCILNTHKSEDMNLIKYLLDVIRTNGYKLMWYDFSDFNTENTTGQLLYQIAQNPVYGHQLTTNEATEFGIDSNHYHLHVLLFDAQYKHSSSKGSISYDFKGVVLPVEDSTL